MQYKITSILVLTYFLINCGYSFAQSSGIENNDASARQSNSRFIDNFAWVDSERSDLHEVNFVGGYSFHSTKSFWGKIPEATLKLFALRYNRKLLTYKKRHVIEYVAELNLAANYTLSNTPRYQAGEYSGMGITPIGFQFNLWQNNLIQPFFKSSAGFMYFSKPFPDDRGVRFNFTLELGGGLEFIVAKNLSFTFGYKYHHMSNGQFGQINPGIDSNIFYSGFTIF